MKIKKTRHGFSFKAENSDDSKVLGNLIVAMSKKEGSPAGIKEGEPRSCPLGGSCNKSADVSCEDCMR